MVRFRHEAGGAIIRPKLIDHKDKAEERPIDRVALNVSVQFPAARISMKRPSMKRTKLERAPDNLAACLEQRREYVQRIKLLAAIHKVVNPRRCATDFDVHLCRQ